MILKSPGSRLSIVNLFADFILNKLPDNEETIIQVVDCINFYVVKGKTTHKEQLNSLETTTEFTDKFKDLLGDIKVTNVIYLIEYGSKISKKDDLIFTYHNTENCSYHPEQITAYELDNTLSYDYALHLSTISNEDYLVVCSEFPHGYSLYQGRLLYYYGKNIIYNIPPTYPFSTLTLNLSNKLDDEGFSIFSVFNHFFVEKDDVLSSAILDVFDFDFTSLESKLKKEDRYLEITDPLSDYEFLKRINNEFIII